jgi:hypothetical protein
MNEVSDVGQGCTRRMRRGRSGRRGRRGRKEGGRRRGRRGRGRERCKEKGRWERRRREERRDGRYREGRRRSGFLLCCRQQVKDGVSGWGRRVGMGERRYHPHPSLQRHAVVGVSLPAEVADAIIAGYGQLLVELQCEHISGWEWVALTHPSIAPLATPQHRALLQPHRKQPETHDTHSRGRGWVGE